MRQCVMFGLRTKWRPNLRCRRFRRFRRMAAVLAASSAFAACALTDPAPPPAPPSLDFAQRSAMTINASEIILQEDYRPPLARPNVEHEFAVTPAQIVRDWARARLRASGSNGVLTLVIREASVVEQPIEGASSGFLAALRPGRDRRLVGVLKVDATYAAPNRTTTIEVSAEGAVEVDRQASLNEVESQYNALLEALGARLDEAMTRRLRADLQGLVSN